MSNSRGVTGRAKRGATSPTAPSAAISLKGLLKDKGAAYLTPPQVCADVRRLIDQHQRLMTQIRDDGNTATANPLVSLNLRLRTNPLHCDELHWRLRGAMARHFEVPTRSLVDIFDDSEPMAALRETFARQWPQVWPLVAQWEGVRLSAMLRARELTQGYARWHTLCGLYEQRAALNNIPPGRRGARTLCEHYGLDVVAVLPR